MCQFLPQLLMAILEKSQVPTSVLGPTRQDSHYVPPEYEAGRVIRTFTFQHIRSGQFNPLAPFANAYEYKLARFFHESRTSLKDIDIFFKNNLLPVGLPEGANIHFRSSYT